jgi:hypothetical protein
LQQLRAPAAETKDFTVSAQATIVDLTTGASASGTIGDALFFATDQQAEGTGFIDSKDDSEAIETLERELGRLVQTV